MRFRNRKALVTGASSGIGEATARQLAQEGAQVALVARRKDVLQKIADQIVAAGGRATVFAADLANGSACSQMVDAVASELGGLDLLVNNAAYNARGPVDRVPAENLARIVDVNLRAPIVIARAALPHLQAAPHASMINVASIAGQVPLPDEATYSATKFGLRAFTLALAEELSQTTVRVGLVSPGPVETPFITDHLDDVPDLVFSQPMSSPEQIATLILASAEDGPRERTHPWLSGKLATASYVVPGLPKLIRPLFTRIGRRAKARFHPNRSV